MGVHTARSQSAANFVQGPKTLSQRLLTVGARGVVSMVSNSGEGRSIDKIFLRSSLAAQ
jgi:hypothetical protein